MIAAALGAILSLAMSCACTSLVGDAAPAPPSRLLTVFRTYRTGVLAVREDEIDAYWLCRYRPLPTKESVDRIDKLLFGGPADVARCHSAAKTNLNVWNALATMFAKIPCCGSEGHAAKDLHNVLIVAMVEQERANRCYSWMFLAKYVVFKAVLYGGLDGNEAKAIKSVRSKLPKWEKWPADLGRLINCLTGAKGSIDLFAALASSSHIPGVCEALSDLNIQSPDVVTQLVEECVNNRASAVSVPSRLFSCLNDEAQYIILGAADTHWVDSKPTSWRSMYLLSRFSGFPSNGVRDWSLKNRSKYLIYEEAPCEMGGNLLVRMDCFDPRTIPREIWVWILLYCDNPMFQIYTVPMVCKFWRCTHHALLSQSSTVQREFVRDLKDTSTMRKTCNYRRYPWNYFLRSPWALFSYSLLCLENTQPSASREITTWVRSHWKHIMKCVGKGMLSVSPTSYIDLYVRCCKVVRDSVELHQLPGMSNKEYVAVVRRLVDWYSIVPAIPERFLGEDCGVFVQMLEDDSDLAALLLRNAPHGCEKLATNLFLTRPFIPPTVERALSKASVLYRMLMDDNENIEERLNLILRHPIGYFGRNTLARSVVDFCLRRGSKYELGVLKLLGENIWRCYLNQHRKDKVACRKHLVLRKLSSRIMRFLCAHSHDYSEEEFHTVEQVLDKVGVFNEYSKPYALSKCIARILNDPEVAVKLIQ